MHFDDRLATVLRLRATGERAARTQFRQLIDLLGERPQAGDRALKAAAYLRLIALGEMIPHKIRAAIVGEAGWRFRNPELVKWFGQEHPHVAAAALYRAQLTGEEWKELIPEMPIRARGFLRHRRDLPRKAVEVLDQLGVTDRALPHPEPLERVEELEPPQEHTVARGPAPQHLDDEGAIRKTTARAAPAPIGQIYFGTDAEGRIDWADRAMGPMVIGVDLGSAGSEAVKQGLARRQPLSNARLILRGAPPIEGAWLVDATPRFTRGEGRFTGYAGRLRRIAQDPAARGAAEADRLRQVLHELRTPVNAMQGYTEIIQQQIVGPVPHEYRSIAATIASDAAHILAGFEELDRLAKLESGAVELETGRCDFAAIAHRQIAQLQPVLAPRVARLEANFSDARAPVGLDQTEGERLAWRILATLAGAIGAGETVAIEVDTSGDQIAISCGLPVTLRETEDIFSARAKPVATTLSAGVFGAGFALRLARAEARAAGGELARDGDSLVLCLPLLEHAEPAFAPQSANG